jgi:hypothetical protein
MKQLVVAFDNDRRNRITAPGRKPEEDMSEIAATGRLGFRVVYFA